MIKQTKTFIHNKKYKEMLQSREIESRISYLYDIRKLKKKVTNSRFLDVGCGTGLILRHLENRKDNYGIDISSFFVKELVKDKYNVAIYDGLKFPFPDNKFGIVGSSLVLEHVSNPELFIKEMIRVTMKDGYIILACPNFLSFFNSARKETKISKLIKIIRYSFGKNTDLMRMEPIYRDEFQPDDDAIVETNTIQILKILKEYDLKIEKVKGVIRCYGRVVDFISSLPVVRLFLPTCYIVAQKPF